MPISLDPNKVGAKNIDDSKEAVQSVDYDYDYGHGLNLKPGSLQHEKLKNEVLKRANASATVARSRHDEWRSIDASLRAYVNPDKVKEKSNKAKKGSRFDPSEGESMPSVVMPVSFATLETLLTYMTTTFLQDPIFRYKGTNPSSMAGAQILERVIANHCRRSSVGLNLHTQWRDAFAYGIGIVSPSWVRRYGKRPRKRELGTRDSISNLFIVEQEELDVEEDKLIYEGNKLVNIDPYTFLPDPNVSIDRVQEGEFVAWVDKTNGMELLRRERDQDDFVTNARYVKHIDGRSQLALDNKGVRDKKDSEGATSTVTNPVHVIWMYLDLIPREFELGESNYPETWLFGLAGDNVIVAAQPLGLHHGIKPVVVCAPDYDGYSITPTSRMGMIHDLQHLMDFLFSSHIQNVRKAINDMIVVDPSIINYHDLIDPKPGKIIRKKRAGWGRGGIREHIDQLRVEDVTRQHVQDSQFIDQFIHRVTSATEELGGQMKPRTSRVSATEARGIRSGGLNKLQKVAQIISMQAMQPLGYMFASHAQQLTQEETWVEASLEWEQQLLNDFGIQAENHMVKVKPTDLLIEYDVMEHDGSMPGTEDEQTWIELYQILAQSPDLMQQFDMTKVFKHIARQMGAKNVDHFIRNTAVQSDEEVARQVERGNLVDADEMEGVINGQRRT